ncbi:MAG: Hsp20/alpha crystallin family protein [Bacteroidia bacterium]
MTLVKFNNNNGLIRPYSLFPEMRTLIDSFFNENNLSTLPSVNISEDDNSYHLELSAPGFEKDNFKISVEDNFINISGDFNKEKEEKNKNYTHKEFSHQSFTRSFRLPENVKLDEISAKDDN